MHDFTAAHARRIALAAQDLTRRPRDAPYPSRGLPALRRAIDHLQLLQLDSVPVVARSHYLPLYSRLGPYEARLLDRIAYHHDEWFETWAHEASLAPVSLEPFLRFMKTRAAAGHTWKGLHRLAQEQPAYVESVYREVADRGPTSAGELSDPRPSDGGAWWSTRSQGALALDWLYRTGRLGVRRRTGFEKVFDLIENIVPADVLSRPTPAPADAVRELLRRSMRALGVATAEDLIDYFRLPPRLAREALAALVENGEIVPCTVRGWTRPAWCAPGTRAPGTVRARALLSPFDPVVWCRDRALRLFGFDYRIEIYTPAHKRRFGYYVMPFLLNDALVARLDLKNDREAGRLQVLASHLETGRDPAHVAHELAAELARLAHFLGAGAVRVHPRGDLAPALAAALGD